MVEMKNMLQPVQQHSTKAYVKHASMESYRDLLSKMVFKVNSWWSWYRDQMLAHILQFRAT